MGVHTDSNTLHRDDLMVNVAAAEVKILVAGKGAISGKRMLPSAKFKPS